MIIHKDSHLDHGISQDQMRYLVEKFADRNGFFAETVELPASLGTVPCGLYGPVMGDSSIGPGLVSYERRGSRPYLSRMYDAKMRLTRKVTVIAGPHDGQACVLYTAFGGPLAPKEVGDPSLKPEERAEAEAFWANHALATDEDL